MRVAVIGAGIAGLSAARDLGAGGHSCDVYERWPGLGGQVASLDVGDGHMLERYYHHLFTSDQAIVELYEELGMAEAIQWCRSSMAMFVDGASHPFTSPLDLLRFSPVSIATRLRMGLAVLGLQRRHRSVEHFEAQTAREWIVKAMGPQAWDKVWGPLLRGKFGDRADSISMGWLWSKLTVRRQIKGAEAREELLGYPRGGWQPLLERLVAEIESHGGRVLIDRPALRISAEGGGFEITAGAAGSFRRGLDPRQFEPEGEPESYDAVLATVPNDVFDALLDEELSSAVGSRYRSKLESIEYHTALCVLIEMDRSFTPFYWTNIADPGLPFVGLVEHTNLVSPGDYGDRRFLYIANYVQPGDPLLSLGFEALLHAYEPGLKQVNPDYTRDWVKRFWVHSEPAAQPIVTTDYRERIPDMQTPVRGLMLANTTQIYPEDRGTNYSVRLGREAAAAMLVAMPATARA